MTLGKNDKAAKKGQKKKVIDPLTRKEWFELKAPAPFKSESFGWTCGNRSSGQYKVETGIKGRVVTQTQADLAPKQDSFSWRKVKLIVDQVEGRQAITSFHGIDTTRDELASLIKKRRTLIEVVQEVKSADGYLLRIFSVCLTKNSDGQKKKTNYALSSQQRSIRRKMAEIIHKEISKCNATEILQRFSSDAIEKSISKTVSRIYPVRDVKVRKVKVIQRPKIDNARLSDMHNPEKRTLKDNTGRTNDRKGKRNVPVEETPAATTEVVVDESANLINRE